MTLEKRSQQTGAGCDQTLLKYADGGVETTAARRTQHANIPRVGGWSRGGASEGGKQAGCPSMFRQREEKDGEHCAFCLVGFFACVLFLRI